MPFHGCNTIKSLSPVTITSAFAANAQASTASSSASRQICLVNLRAGRLGETLVLVDQLLGGKAGTGDMMRVFWAIQNFADFIDQIPAGERLDASGVG